MPFDAKKLRHERLQAQISHHAAFNFWNLRGVLAERWGHGPIFGAFTDAGQQITLQPPPDQKDQRLQAIYGIKASGMLAEGPHWVPRSRELAVEWVTDVLSVLKPKRTVGVRVDAFALYPITNPESASQRLRARFYNDQELAKLAPSRFDFFHAAVELFAPEPLRTSVIVGAVGPPHEGQFFTYPDEERDKKWWMGIRLHYQDQREEGISDPLDTLRYALDRSQDDLSWISRTALPDIVA